MAMRLEVVAVRVPDVDRPGRPGFGSARLEDPDGDGWTIQEIPPG
jgi:hypothetical protein